MTVAPLWRKALTKVATVAAVLAALVLVVTLSRVWPDEFGFDRYERMGVLPPIYADMVGWGELVGCILIAASIAAVRGRRLGRVAHGVVITMGCAATLSIGLCALSWGRSHRTSLPSGLPGKFEVILAISVVNLAVALVTTAVRELTVARGSGRRVA